MITRDETLRAINLNNCTATLQKPARHETLLTSAENLMASQLDAPAITSLPVIENSRNPPEDRPKAAGTPTYNASSQLGG